MFTGVEKASIPRGSGCSFLGGPLPPLVIGGLPLFPIGAQGNGAGSISFPAVVPTNFRTQAFSDDPSGTGGFSNSAGVKLTID